MLIRYSKGPYALQVRKVELHRDNAARTRPFGLDALSGMFATVEVAAGENDRGATTGESGCCVKANSAICARNDRRKPAKVFIIATAHMSLAVLAAVAVATSSAAWSYEV